MLYILSYKNINKGGFMFKDKIAEAANNFLIGEGPFVTILSANSDGMDCYEDILSDAKKLGGMYLFDCYIGNNFLDKKIAISGLYPTQAVFLAKKYKQKTLIQKEWDGKIHYMSSSNSWWASQHVIEPTGFLYLSKMKNPDGSNYLSMDFKI
jgi:hypothetical protein